MSLESDYELLEVLRDDGVQSFRAKEISTGRSLEVHLFLPFGRPENKILFERLKGLPLESRRAFLDVGTDGSTPFIVTDPLPEIRGFREWVETLFVPATPAAPVPRPAIAPDAARKAPARPPDEAVQILQAGQWRTGTPLPQALVTPPQPAPPPLPVIEEPADQTGEFTGLFQSSFQPAPKEPNAEPEPEPGEFTKLFKTPLSASKPSPPATTGSLGPAGEFTRLFESPLQPAPLPQTLPDVHAETPLPRTTAPPQAQRGSEFTQVFGGPSSSRQTPPPPSSPFVSPPPPSGASGVPSATGAFSSGGQFASAPPPRSSSGPSEYTRMMSAPVQPAPGQMAPVAPSAASPASAAKSNTPLFIVLGVLALLAILVVIYFLLSHR